MVGCLVIAALFGLSLLVVLNHFLPLILHFKSAPRGSFGWPVVGETLSFLTPHTSNSLGRFLDDHCSRFGKVFKSHLFCSPTVVSCDQELNHFILQNEEKLFQCSYPKPIHGILGESSMLVVVGDTHKRLRSQALTLISTTKSKGGYLNDIERTAIQVVESWKGKEQIIFCEEARKFTFNVIVKQVLGLTPDEPQTNRILEDFLTFMKGLVSFPFYIPGTPYARAVQARARISSTVKGIIEERRKKGEEANKRSDFLDMLLPVKSLSEGEKVSFVLDSLLGGYETTSLLMAMTVHFLGQSPLALEQLKLELSNWSVTNLFSSAQSEHQNIKRNKKKDEYLNWEDYKRMEFTQNVINEALRCGNIVKFVHRKAIKDVRFKGSHYPLVISFAVYY
ncbi:hypothetical protein QJS10_CPA08g01881 [Acorus calamus]|uniref:Cytochrome P450 n=1 Tax=Acorus calamus TaxID=4465 RepID=A0AAV9EFK9_ACOCL|nr:hypothetical protein QJS10_CPA08g01881 [Acorus calamus]